MEDSPRRSRANLLATLNGVLLFPLGLQFQGAEDSPHSWFFPGTLGAMTLAILGGWLAIMSIPSIEADTTWPGRLRNMLAGRVAPAAQGVSGACFLGAAACLMRGAISLFD